MSHPPHAVEPGENARPVGPGAPSPDLDWRVIFDNAPDPILVYPLDAAGRPLPYIEVNDAALLLYGYAREEMLGMTSLDLVDPDAIDVPSALESLRRDRRRYFESVHITKDGRRIPMLVHVHRFENDGQEFILGICRDVSRLKRTEAALAAEKRHLEERVAERTAVAEEQARQLRRLAQELTRAEQTERRRLATTLHDHLQQLLVAAKFRLEATSARREVGNIDLLAEVEDLIDQAVGVSRSLAAELSPPVLHDAGLCAALEWLARWVQEKHHLSVQLDLDREAEPACEQVRVLLFEAARELLFNVKKHAGVDAAHVTLSVTDDHLRLMITDHGAGFDPATVDRNGTTAPGLGLRGMRERVAYFGGRLEITPAHESGTRVAILMPRNVTLDSPKIRNAPTHDLGADSSRVRGEEKEIRVLLADDHKILREGLASLLKGFEDINVVGEAEDGVDAVELALELVPDVVVMDITMPRMNGIDATRKIVQALPHVRVIGLSMHDEGDMAGALRRAGGTAYLTKGGPANALIDAIRLVSHPGAPGEA